MKWLLLASFLIVSLSSLSGSKIERLIHQDDQGIFHPVLNFGPNLREKNFIQKCLTHQRMLSGHHNRKMCHKLQLMVEEMSNRESGNRRGRDVNNIKLRYLNELVRMRNGYLSGNVSPFRDQMLDMIAPCARFAPSMNRKWKSFMKKRTQLPHPKGFTFSPESQWWEEDKLMVRFSKPNFTTNDYLSYDRVAVDLIFHRTPPCQIDEQFGTYSITVKKLAENTEESMSIILHSSNQSSCPTMEGYLMVISLNLELSMSWFFNEEQPLLLSIHVRTIDQLFTDSSIPARSENVIRKVMSLMVSLHENSENHEPSRRNNNALESGTAMSRERRSASERRRRLRTDDTSACHRANYTIDFKTDIQWSSFLRPRFDNPDPTDIGECSGVCDWSSLASRRSSHHALIMKEQETNRRNPPVKPTVCCAPTGYRDLMVWGIDSTNTLTDFVKTNLVVTTCNCV